MSERAERLLREAVHELAGTPHQPSDFAATAVRQGRRMRRRRQVIATAAAAVAVGAIVAPYVWLRPDSQPPPLSIGGPPAPTASASAATNPPTLDTWRNGPVPLPGGALLLSAGSSGQAGPTWVYDPAKRRYVSIPAAYPTVRASSRLSLAAVIQPDRPTEVGLYDLATGEVQWVEAGGTVTAAEWSPDGRQLLLTLRQAKAGMHVIGLLSPVKPAVRQQPVKMRSLTCGSTCRFSWLPNGKEVALAETAPIPPGAGPGVEAAKAGIQLFLADTGTPTRYLPVRGAVADSSAWSPGGTFVVVSSQPAALARGNPTSPPDGNASGQSDGQSVTELVAVDSGEVLRRLPSADVTWVTPRRLLYLDTPGPDGRVSAVLLDVSGKEIERTVLPLELVGSDEIVLAPR
ncbi:hypothetical protein [Plantactinospora endophytica]|uniref:WD40 repeat domain-containing protein n=1 Tax=Plantactinospora endophytica TaxID=673535 RepID=A0ABQ4E2W7_9ACTN|nr:hypothetical protein [Plantactinospora endophytica]GIG89054.1 hypothetical protein Pen02_39900 [Plantactinospora endophytica]